MGAEVVKIEGVRPLDHTREVGPFTDDTRSRNRSGYFNSVNGAKKSVALQLNDSAQAALARELAVTSDIVVESFMAGSMERFGLGFAALAAENPRLVMISCSGFGRTGPMAAHSAYMNTVAAYVGLTALNSGDGFPTPVGATFSDLVAGTSIAYAALLGVRRARATGRGAWVDISMAEASMALMGEPFMTHFAGAAAASASTGQFAPRGVYRTSGDDKWIAVSVRTDAQWASLIAVMGNQDLATGDMLAGNEGRIEHSSTIDAAIAAWARNFDNIELTERLQAAGVPAAPASDPEDVIRNPHFLARGAVAPQDDPLEPGHLLPNLPWHFGGFPGLDSALPRAPRLGEHNDDVLATRTDVESQLLDHLNAAAAIAAVGPEP